MLNLYNHYKFHHFFSFCFGLGCGLVSFRPYHSLVMPYFLTAFFTIAFEIVGISFGLPPHTRKCKGSPYKRKDVYWGLCTALPMALFNLDAHHFCTLSYGCGLIVFSIRGEIRKCKSLWKKHRRYY